MNPNKVLKLTLYGAAQPRTVVLTEMITRDGTIHGVTESGEHVTASAQGANLRYEEA